MRLRRRDEAYVFVGWEDEKNFVGREDERTRATKSRVASCGLVLPGKANVGRLLSFTDLRFTHHYIAYVREM